MTYQLPEIGPTDLLTAQQEAEIFREYRNSGSLEARALLVRCNLRLVKKVAQGYASRYPAITFDDLVSEGSLALLRAIELFDVDRGLKFSTYLWTCVRYRLTRYVRRTFGHRSRWRQGPDVDDWFGRVADRRQSPTDLDVLPLLGRLKPRDRAIINARYGLDGQAPQTLDDVALTHNVSGERVRQLERRAVKRLKAVAGV